ncbi:MAG: molybdopterin converting factor subunit 1 [Dehalococcoidia bacterium]
MQIRVLLFASLREAAGQSELRLELPPDSDAGAVLRELEQRLPRSSAVLQRSVLAVNEEYASADVRLHDNDVVAMIPPVSGGFS